MQSSSKKSLLFFSIFVEGCFVLLRLRHLAHLKWVAKHQSVFCWRRSLVLVLVLVLILVIGRVVGLFILQADVGKICEKNYESMNATRFGKVKQNISYIFTSFLFQFCCHLFFATFIFLFACKNNIIFMLQKFLF